jgi:hypothetical protein
MQDSNDEPRTRGKRMVRVAAVGAAGLVAGGVLAGTLSANAATDSSQQTGSGTADGQAPNGGPQGNGNTDPTKPMRSDEKLLTGATKAKVTAAVKAKYPKATFQRVETDSDGVYEAHVVNNGAMLTVKVGKDFTVTGVDSGPPAGGRGQGGTPPSGAPTGAPSGAPAA